MATYKEEHGTGIVKVTTDPENPVVGQVWYNSTDQALKGFTSNPVGSWATGGNMNTARGSVAGTPAGTTSAAMVSTGQTAGGTKNSSVEQYNGSSWTETTDVNTARSNLGAAGTSTSNLIFNGDAPPDTNKTESWNGTSWTEVNDTNVTTSQRAGCGADNTSALAFGGYTAGFKAETESWNGTSWTEVNDLNTARSAMSGNGIITAAISAGGESPAGNETKTELWNGTSWTETTDMNAAVREGAMTGTYTAALQAGGKGGSAPPTGTEATCESWNGSTWTEVADLNTARYQLNNGQSGSSTAGLVFGGKPTYSPPTAVTASTEQYTSPLETTVTFTTT